MTGRTVPPRPTRRLAVAVAGAVTVLACVAAAPALAADPPRRDLRLPVPGPALPVTPFDPPAQRWLPGHRGVDLAAAAFGPVRAPAAGTVSFAGPVAGRPVLAIDHGDGLRTTYEPVRAAVRVGQEVGPGQVVGRVLPGHPGCPVEVCLHWGARLAAGGPAGDDDEYLDPLSLLSGAERPVRLKPLRPGDGGH